MTKNILNKKSVKLVGLRDKQAMEYAKKIGIKEEKTVNDEELVAVLTAAIA